MTIKQRPPSRDQLKEVVEVADVPGENRESQLLRLQQQDTILKGAEPSIFLVALKSTQNA